MKFLQSNPVQIVVSVVHINPVQIVLSVAHINPVQIVLYVVQKVLSAVHINPVQIVLCVVVLLDAVIVIAQILLDLSSVKRQSLTTSYLLLTVTQSRSAITVQRTGKLCRPSADILCGLCATYVRPRAEQH